MSWEDGLVWACYTKKRDDAPYITVHETEAGAWNRLKRFIEKNWDKEDGEFSRSPVAAAIERRDFADNQFLDWFYERKHNYHMTPAEIQE
jgi:ferritin